MTTVTTSNDIIAILDSSGSMLNLNGEPMEALNGFISDQKASNDDGTFSLWTFNTVVTNVIDDQPLRDVKPYTDYTPSGMTAICDAIGKAIDMKLTKNNHKDVICLVVTDGMENSSQEYNGDQIKQMISNMEINHNWKFIYLGANQDVFTVGAGYGMNQANCVSFSPEIGGLLQVTRNMSATISAYRSSSYRDGMNFNLEGQADICPINSVVSRDSTSGLRPRLIVRQKNCRILMQESPPPIINQNGFLMDVSM